MTLGCAMVVRDAAETLAATLATVRPYVDRVAVVVDDRTEDGTVALLEQAQQVGGASIEFTVARFEGFSRARNASFDLVGTDWVLWLDDDLLLGGSNLRDLVRQAAASDVNWIDVAYDYGDNTDGTAWITRRSRVAQRSATRWVGAIHEDLVPVPHDQIALSASANPSELSVRHLRRAIRPAGYYLEEIRAATSDLDESPFAFLHLGKELLAVGDAAGAVEALDRFISERHELRVATEHNWGRIEALDRAADACEQLGDAVVAAALRAQAVSEKDAGDAFIAETRAARLARPAANAYGGVGRNDPCPCGSGLKFKKCHGG